MGGIFGCCFTGEDGPGVEMGAPQAVVFFSLAFSSVLVDTDFPPASSTDDGLEVVCLFPHRSGFARGRLGVSRFIIRVVVGLGFFVEDFDSDKAFTLDIVSGVPQAGVNVPVGKSPHPVPSDDDALPDIVKE